MSQASKMRKWNATSNTSGSIPYRKLMDKNSQSDVESMKNSQSLAKTGAKLGAAAGARYGPIATGLASGVGGAVGYLAGNAVDGVSKSLEAKRALPDGGRSHDTHRDADSSVVIPVTEDSDQ
ncbi:MAG: hypothetical protein A07HR60_02046 [uncultured archaeon A07HR60]|jgi:hypothetical protein|nr:MAG: hypothetical protein A07HR60_02046 [uncultured archaeon A07HR60]